MSHKITIEGGTSVRLPTAGKYCDRDIVITSTGGKEDLDDVLTEQDTLIDELKAVLVSKANNVSVIEPLEITENGTYTAPDGVDGYSPVTVNVSAGTAETWTITYKDGTIEELKVVLL